MDQLSAIKDPQKRNERLIELNVQEQCINLFKNGMVQNFQIKCESHVAFTPQMAFREFMVWCMTLGMESFESWTLTLKGTLKSTNPSTLCTPKSLQNHPH